MQRNKIVEIREKDCSLIESFQLKHKEFFGNNIWTASEINNFITSPKNLLLMSKIKNKPVGISFFISVNLNLEIYTIFIEKSYRNKKIGTEFLALAKKFGRKMMFDKILLEVNEKNKTALNFYLKNDFKKIGFKKGYYTSCNHENAFLMKLDI